MNGKKNFYSEAAYIAGIVILALGAALMEKGNLGLSMVVAPAYLLHLKVSQAFAWFTFGVAEYTLQAVLLVIICIALRRPRPMYLFSLITAVIYGNILDLMISLVSFISAESMVIRILCYLIGMLLSSIGIAFLFHTYIAPEAYELLVKEISSGYHKDINKTKTVYDICSCAVAVIMSFAFFGLGHFEGVKLGTIVCALINGSIIGACSRVMESWWDFSDGTKFRKYFQ